jgi:hypothetical protein
MFVFPSGSEALAAAVDRYTKLVSSNSCDSSMTLDSCVITVEDMLPLLDYGVDESYSLQISSDSTCTALRAHG